MDDQAHQLSNSSFSSQLTCHSNFFLQSMYVYIFIYLLQIKILKVQEGTNCIQDPEGKALKIKDMMETSLHQEGMLNSVFYTLLKVCRLVNGMEFHSSNTRLYCVFPDWKLLEVIVFTMYFTSTKLQPVSFIQCLVMLFALLSIFTFTS